MRKWEPEDWIFLVLASAVPLIVIVALLVGGIEP